ncbi:hypothetical protein Hypma_001929 [Hypsizygus marmoreus]|uniref:Protein kinase domain-containing protein n=1 Tax=Hypsizygus marmoreus TaxID=39966 RepID=A0A369J4X9_HYPMA|nr:hypothetical protein Hypma_001929 [Hypsizygus marmoreus]
MAQLLVAGSLFHDWSPEPFIMQRVDPTFLKTIPYPTSISDSDSDEEFTEDNVPPNHLGYGSSFVTSGSIHGLVECTVDKAPCSHAGHWTMKNPSDIYRGRYILFRALLQRPEFHDPVDAVLKFSHQGKNVDSLLHEANIYENHVKDLQGDVIPRCFGVFQATIAENLITCLITEYCGSPIEGSNICSWGPEDFFWEVIRKLDRLHKHGFAHGDFKESNVVNNNGVPFIIDLEHAKPHICKRALLIKKSSIQPTNAADLNCEELYYFIIDLPLWGTSLMYIGRLLLPAHELKTPEDILDYMDMDYDEAQRYIDMIQSAFIPHPLPPFTEHPENDDEI